jgi:hypothetical protein
MTGTAVIKKTKRKKNAYATGSNNSVPWMTGTAVIKKKTKRKKNAYATGSNNSVPPVDDGDSSEPSATRRVPREA